MVEQPESGIHYDQRQTISGDYMYGIIHVSVNSEDIYGPKHVRVLHDNCITIHIVISICQVGDDQWSISHGIESEKRVRAVQI